ncbi:MAG: orotate phosphoribosyltransferase [Candidatus Schekmanbacteria bacterium]|nr:orotate phosphoribosyltransferase [Candidatus Schekmanbacteria bacterium]
MTIAEKKTQLLTIFKEKALKRGDFTLASGAKSHYYIDGKLVSFHPLGAYLSAELILDSIKDDNLDAVGGLALGAIPISCAVAALSAVTSCPLYSFTVRKEIKEHGTQKRIEGYMQAGWRVAILEDVVSTGGSSFTAIEAIEQAGAKVIKVIALVDRLMGAKEKFSQAGYTLTSLFTRQDLGV